MYWFEWLQWSWKTAHSNWLNFLVFEGHRTSLYHVQLILGAIYLSIWTNIQRSDFVCTWTRIQTLRSILRWFSSVWKINCVQYRVSRYWFRCPHIHAGLLLLVWVSGYWPRCLDTALQAWLLVQMSDCWYRCVHAGLKVWVLTQVPWYWCRFPDISSGIEILPQFYGYKLKCLCYWSKCLGICQGIHI